MVARNHITFLNLWSNREALMESEPMLTEKQKLGLGDWYRNHNLNRCATNSMHFMHTIFHRCWTAGTALRDSELTVWDLYCWLSKKHTSFPRTASPSDYCFLQRLKMHLLTYLLTDNVTLLHQVQQVWRERQVRQALVLYSRPIQRSCRFRVMADSEVRCMLGTGSNSSNTFIFAV